MPDNKEIIKPFTFYPSNKKTNVMTKKFPLIYDQNSNTWIMEGNGIRLINIPNDIWVFTYLRDYVCSFFINAEAITSALRLIQEDGSTKVKKVALARVFAFLYGKIYDILDYRSEANFNVKHYFDENGIMVQDVSPENVIIAHDKEYFEDNEYTYFKIYGVDYYARVNKYIRDFFIENCTNIRYSEKKGIRTSLKNVHNQVSLNNIVYKIYNPGFDEGKGVKLLNYDIQYHDELNIYFMDFSISNLYHGNEVSIDGKYAYIFMPKYNTYSIIDNYIYLKHQDIISKYIWYINVNKHIVANPSSINNYTSTFLHRLVIQLFLQDNGIDPAIINEMDIHHIDQNPLNNTLDNLLICSKFVHGKIHNGAVMATILDSNIKEVANLGYIPEKYIK